MEQLANFFGRFHPLIVHLPIGILILAFLFEALSLLRRYRKFRIVIQPTLFIGSLAAILSVVTGYFLSLEGGYENDLLTSHQYAGIITAVFSVLLLFLRANRKVLNVERTTNKPVRLLLFLPLMISLTITGHWGGSLTHGDEFLSEFTFYSSEEKSDPILKVQQIAQVDQAVLYRDVIQPILESKCYSCHSSKKQKGDLRLDGAAFMMNGGEHGRVIVEGLADSSTLFSRLMLPLEDEDHMPPNEKPQPSSTEIDLIRLWLNEGANFDKKISELRDPVKASQSLTLLIESTRQTSWLPEENVPAANPQAIQDLKNAGAVVLPIANDNNYLSVNFTNVRLLDNKILEKLKPVSEQLLVLRFSYCNFTEANTALSYDFKNLRWLYLDHTNVTDSTLMSMPSLPNLRYLNLAFTSVSDRSLPFVNKLPEVEHIFMYQTRITGNGIRSVVNEDSAIHIDSGYYQLPKLANDTIVYKKRS